MLHFSTAPSQWFSNLRSWIELGNYQVSQFMKQPTKRCLEQFLKKHREYMVRLHTQRKLDTGNLEPTAVFERLPNSLLSRGRHDMVWSIRTDTMPLWQTNMAHTCTHTHNTPTHTNGANTGNNLEEWAANNEKLMIMIFPCSTQVLWTLEPPVHHYVISCSNSARN